MCYFYYEYVAIRRLRLRRRRRRRRRLRLSEEKRFDLDHLHRIFHNVSFYLSQVTNPAQVKTSQSYLAKLNAAPKISRLIIIFTLLVLHQKVSKI